MITSQAAHIHKFVKPAKKKVLLYKDKGAASGFDIIKQRICACGKIQAYDLERTVT